MAVNHKITPTSTRQIAVTIICAVVQHGQSLTEALSICDKLEPRDRAFCRELCYGTLRWYTRLEAILSLLLKKAFKSKDIDITVLALLGLYQIIYMGTPDHAAVSETVNACAGGKKRWAKGVLNAVLRNFLREREKLEATVDTKISQQFSHPDWLIKHINHDWGEDTKQILQANNQHPPMSLRINQRITSREDYIKQLSDNDVIAFDNPLNTVGITLERPANVDQLPQFWDGACSVQDNAAQLAAELLNVENGNHILDVCAAPGGKTAHILESAPSDVSLIAIDIDENRNQRVIENLDRLKLKASVLTVDGTEPIEWFDDKKFQRILLDAPCSATGVIRRHPDIKHLRKPSDISELVKLQRQLLDAIWPLLAENGVLLYATCSILATENSRQITSFMADNNDAKNLDINAEWGRPCRIGRQILPGDSNMDGFYYARLTKTP